MVEFTEKNLADGMRFFQYNSCPVCNSPDVFKDKYGFQQCHFCIRPFSAFSFPKSEFIPRNQGIGQVIGQGV